MATETNYRVMARFANQAGWLVSNKTTLDEAQARAEVLRREWTDGRGFYVTDANFVEIVAVNP